LVECRECRYKKQRDDDQIRSSWYCLGKGIENHIFERQQRNGIFEEDVKNGGQRQAEPPGEDGKLIEDGLVGPGHIIIYQPQLRLD